jgi:MscS family membrane protein
MAIGACGVWLSGRACILGILLCASLGAQKHVLAEVPAPVAKPGAAKDALGRNSPRGTALGFVVAARSGNMETASLYLDTELRGAEARELAQQLFTVLDLRLPPRLAELSDSPEGSLSTFKPNLDRVGTISSVEGNVDILVERVPLGNTGQVWLFSKETLARIPGLFAELNAVQVDRIFPKFMSTTRIVGIPLFNFLGVFVVMPGIYLLLSLLSGLLGVLIVAARHPAAVTDSTPRPQILSHPVRLIIIALFIWGCISKLALPLVAREVWGTGAVLMAIVASVWLSFRLNERLEKHLRRRLAHQGKMGAASVVHLGRRLLELLILAASVLTALYLCGFRPSTVLAGLGIGSIAVALAAQKTLENVIGGVSIISDRVLRVGDMMKVGDTIGTVEQIGLRSTRIRTRDRTVVSVPNGILANLSLECLSTRDKYWFHPNLRLRFDTSAEQIRAILDGTRDMLTRHPLIDPISVRVQLLQFGADSFDLDVFAYIKARDWNHFAQVQEELLLRYLDTVEAAGAQIALQAPVYVVPPVVKEHLTAMK